MELTKEVKLFGQKLLISQSSFNNVFIELIEDAVSTVELSDGTKIEVDLKEVINKVINTQLRLFIPYKFEELKEDMWVWDNEDKICFQIILLKEEIVQYPFSKEKATLPFIVRSCRENPEYGEGILFDEERFYPILTYKSLLEKDNEEE